MSYEDDTFSDSDSSSSGGTYVYTGSSNCHGHRHTSGSGVALALILLVAVIVVVVAASGEKSHSGERREQQTAAMIDGWAQSMHVHAIGHSCEHERSRALCDVRLDNGDTKHLQCGKGGCSER